jgi:DNA-binding transcriptional regulator LsrR (DeoR family)
MIDPEKRKVIYYLYSQGMPIRKIARQLQVDRNTVRAVVQLQGELPGRIRSDKIEFCPELIGRLYRECDGYAQRIHEKLTEQYDVVIGYLPHQMTSPNWSV